MRKFWFCYWLILIVVFLPAPAPGAETIFKDLPATEITGYGEYSLGTPVAQLDLKGFEEPVKDTSFAEIPGYNYGKLDIFHGKRSAKVKIVLITIDGRLEAITLEFPQLITEFGDLDKVASFVRSLRGSIVSKYSPELIDADFFAYGYESSDWAWEGALSLIDKSGNELFLVWDGYDLSLHYLSAKFQRLVAAAFARAEQEDAGKL